MEGDPQLFGAPPGPVSECDLTVRPPRQGQLGSVTIYVYVHGRERPMVLTIQSLESESMAVVTGLMVPIVLAAHWKAPRALKQHLWAVFRQCGVAGRECAIQGCGKPPK